MPRWLENWIKRASHFEVACVGAILAYGLLGLSYLATQWIAFEPKPETSPLGAYKTICEGCRMVWYSSAPTTQRLTECPNCPFRIPDTIPKPTPTPDPKPQLTDAEVEEMAKYQPRAAMGMNAYYDEIRKRRDAEWAKSELRSRRGPTAEEVKEWVDTHPAGTAPPASWYPKGDPWRNLTAEEANATFEPE